MPNSEQGPNPQVNIENFSGQAFFLGASVKRHAPEIPDEMGRPCHQCRHVAWLKSRWCWNCGFDFERAALPRIHPSKIAALSLALNALLCFVVGFALYTAHKC